MQDDGFDASELGPVKQSPKRNGPFSAISMRSASSGAVHAYTLVMLGRTGTFSAHGIGPPARRPGHHPYRLAR